MGLALGLNPTLFRCRGGVMIIGEHALTLCVTFALIDSSHFFNS